MTRYRLAIEGTNNAAGGSNSFGRPARGAVLYHSNRDTGMRSRVATCLLFAGLWAAHPAAASGPGTTDEQALALLSATLMDAVAKKDKPTLERLVADGFVLQAPGDNNSQFTRRREWIANAVRMDWADFRHENLVAQVHGDRATVSARLHFRVAPYPFALDAGVVDTWERQGADWRITRRYLGQSNAQQRIAFILGGLATGLAAAVAYAIARLARRSRRRVT